MWFYLINTSAYVVSRKSRSAVKKNRIMKLYFFKRYDWPVVWSRDLDHVKAKQENAFPHSEGMHTRWRDCPCFACLFILIFMVFWHQSTLCKVISLVADTVNSDLPAFCLVQATVENFIPQNGKVVLQNTQKWGSESPLCDILEVLPRFITERKDQANVIAEWYSYFNLTNSCRSYLRI